MALVDGGAVLTALATATAISGATALWVFFSKEGRILWENIGKSEGLRSVAVIVAGAIGVSCALLGAVITAWALSKPPPPVVAHVNIGGELNFTSSPNLQSTGPHDHGLYSVRINPPYKNVPDVRIIPDDDSRKPIIRTVSPAKIELTFADPGPGKSALSGFMLQVLSKDD